MNLRVVFRRAALDDYLTAVAWYEARRRGLGQEFSTEVAEAIERAARQPLLYAAVLGDVRRTVTRRFPFAIYFRIRDDAIVVIAVFHGRRDPAVWRRRD